MPDPTDHYRRQHEAQRKAAMEALVASRKQDWKDAGLLDDIARQRVVETAPSIWKGKPWWVERRWVRLLVNALCAFALFGVFRAAMHGAAFDLAFWIPLAVFAFKLRLHLTLYGG